MAHTYELEKWIKATGHGDRDALAALYHATSSAVYAYALSVLKDRGDAEDAMQDCYLAIRNCAGDYRPKGKPMAWIITITRNICYKQLRQQKWTVPLTDVEYFIPGGADPADGLMLRLCLRELGDQERQIVVLHAIAGLKHRQIAALLGLKLSTVLSKYHRALQKLRENL